MPCYMLILKTFHSSSKMFLINANIVGINHYFESDHSNCEWEQVKHK